MNAVATWISALLTHLGVFGLVVVGILDSSFLVLPMGNDLLLTVLSARHHSRVPIYVLSSAVGSAGGVLLLDLVSRKGGEKGLEKVMKPQQFERLKQKIDQHAAVALITASLAPPPFPFSAVIVAASALQYPRHRLLTVVFIARTVRFLLVGLIAIWLGRRVIRLIESPGFQWFVIGFAVVCVVASAVSIVSWIRRSRGRAPTYAQ
jgi:membrane protein YqaA with SNARE-associated domain